LCGWQIRRPIQSVRTKHVFALTIASQKPPIEAKLLPPRQRQFRLPVAQQNDHHDNGDEHDERIAEVVRHGGDLPVAQVTSNATTKATATIVAVNIQNKTAPTIPSRAPRVSALGETVI
jgi:hypothetical protein